MFLDTIFFGLLEWRYWYISQISFTGWDLAEISMWNLGVLLGSAFIKHGGTVVGIVPHKMQIRFRVGCCVHHVPSAVSACRSECCYWHQQTWRLLLAACSPCFPEYSRRGSSLPERVASSHPSNLPGRRNSDVCAPPHFVCAKDRPLKKTDMRAICSGA